MDVIYDNAIVEPITMKSTLDIINFLR